MTNHPVFVKINDKPVWININNINVICGIGYNPESGTEIYSMGTSAPTRTSMPVDEVIKLVEGKA